MKVLRCKKVRNSTFTSRLSVIKGDQMLTNLPGTGPVDPMMDNIIEIAGGPLPERVPVTKVTGAYGKFTVTADIKKYTCAKLFGWVGKSTKVLVRFGMVGCEEGCADSERSQKEFSIRFYTENGDWDLLGTNLPVLFTNDLKRYNSYFQLSQRNERTNLKDTSDQWRFLSAPESLQYTLMLMSDKGTPSGYRHMKGYGMHTYSFVNAKNERVWIKFHLKPHQGSKELTVEEAQQMRALDMDHACRDLITSIEKGRFPKWTLYFQVMTEQEARECCFNPFDVTKVWSQRDFPLHEIGILTLNGLADNLENDIINANLSLSNIVDGIGYSPDKMLQARLLECARRERLVRPYYSIHKIREERRLESNENLPDYHDYPGYEHDHLTQSRALLYRAMVEPERANLAGNMIRSMEEMSDCNKEKIIKQHLLTLSQLDEDLAQMVSAGLNIDLENVLQTAGLAGR